MGKKRGKKVLNKAEVAEDWCFECKDGGELMICDYGECLKAYHPACVGKDDSVLTSDERWICGWHKCLVCKRKPNYHCYCCDRAVCIRCIRRVDFVLLKEEYGFCNNCLKLALLVEEDRNVDSDGESVDLRDRETYEGLFREYYEIVKEKEGFDKSSLLAGKAQLDKEKICKISSDSDNSEEEDGHSEEEDEQLSSDNGDFSDGEPKKKKLKMKRCRQQKTKSQRSVNSKKKVFVGWGSKALIDFLQFIGQDTREKLSQYDVTSIVTKYIKDHNLVHPVKKRRILCDVRLQAVFGKKVINRHRIFSLLERHFIENEEQFQKDDLDQDLEDDTETLVAPKTEKKLEQKKISSIWCSTAAQSQFAALIPENIKLVYLRRSLVLEMLKQPESIESKILGSFVRVKLDSHDYEQHNSHQLVQVTGIKLRSGDKCNSEPLIQVSNMTGGEIHLERLQVGDIGLTAISNCPTLETLHLVKTPECTDAGVVAVARKCKLLRKLHIDGWRTNRIGDEGLVAIAGNSSNLKELVLIGLNPTSTSILAIASNCQKLERLALCGSDTIGDPEVSCIATKCMALKKLCIKGCEVTDEGIESFAWGCPNLVKIKVKKCKHVTGDVADLLRAKRRSLSVNLNGGEIDIEPVDGSASEGGAIEEPAEFQHTMPIISATHVPSTSNVGRSSASKPWFGFFGGRSLVACTLRRWSNGNGDD